MLAINKARRATLATFKKVIAEGVSQELAAQVALARYRAFFPTAAEADEVRDVVTRTLLPKTAVQRLVFGPRRCIGTP
jgi:hypothetical protein